MPKNFLDRDRTMDALCLLIMRNLNESVKNYELDKNFACEFRGQVLSWYDQHKRSLPWRAEPNEKANPYHVWLSEIMLQQTTVPTVIPYFLKFIDLWPDIDALAAAPQEDVLKNWAGLGYYARARNLHKCAGIISHDYKGQFPSALKDLSALPGIGDYTAAAIRSIAFDLPSVVVDGNIERIISRIFRVQNALPEAKKEIKEHAASLAEGRDNRPGCYAQALMDVGSNICTPKKPKCSICPVHTYCNAFEHGDAEIYPVKALKKKKPKRYGSVYWLTDLKGRALYEKRPDKGLLASMMGLPTTEWMDKPGKATAQQEFLGFSGYKKIGAIKHVFTHFELHLDVRAAQTDDLLSLSLPKGYIVLEEKDAETIGMPTVFMKAYRLVQNL